MGSSVINKNRTSGPRCRGGNSVEGEGNRGEREGTRGLDWMQLRDRGGFYKLSIEVKSNTHDRDVRRPGTERRPSFFRNGV
jgi:hypothetical protein